MKEYPATVVGVVDGDTIDVSLEVFPDLTFEIRTRLLGVDTHETYGVSTDSEEHRRGMEEKEFVEEWLDSQAVLRVRVGEKGKYGRYLAEFIGVDGEILNDRLLEEFDGVSW